jgi:PASTA domain
VAQRSIQNLLTLTILYLGCPLLVAWLCYKYIDIPQKVAVPNVIGLTLSKAEKVAYEAKLSSTIVNVPGGQKDLVVDQTPSTGTMIDEKTAILLTVQTGPLIEQLLPGRIRAARLRSTILPTDTQIDVELPQSIHVEGRAPPSSYQATLSTPLVQSDAVVAEKGAPVLLDISSDEEDASTSVNITVREIEQVDGRPLFVRTKAIEYKTDFSLVSELGSAALTIFICTIIGAIVSAALLFFMIPITPDLGAGCGFLVGILFAVLIVVGAVQSAQVVNVQSGSIVQFRLADSAVARVLSR